MKAVSVIIFCLLMGLGSLAQQGATGATPPPSQEARSSVKPEPTPEAWEFHPSCKEAWEKMDHLLLKNKDPETVLKTTKISCDGTSEARDELDLHRARALEVLEMPLAAQHVYQDVISRSANQPAGQKAFELLDLLARQKAIDEDEMERFVVSVDTKIEPSSAASMISYFKWRSFSRRKLDTWAAAELAKVAAANAWHFELLYRDAQKALAHGNLDSAEDLFKQISQSELTRAVTKQEALLQLSRIAFERKNYKASFEQVQNLELPVREKGRALLQMAWAQYYLRDYGKALGLLEALRTPFFASSLDPERSILQMLLLKDLCQYHYVDSAMKEFYQTFAPSYSAIEGRRVLADNPQMAQLALLDEPLQARANLIHELRGESEKVGRVLKTENGDMRQALQAALNSREATLRFFLKRLIVAKMPALAEYMVDEREQVKAIQYMAKIQSLSTERDLSKEFKADEIPRFEFEKLYWPVQHEYWWDEMPFYQAQISSRCGQANFTAPKAPAAPKTQKKARKPK